MAVGVDRDQSHCEFSLCSLTHGLFTCCCRVGSLDADYTTAGAFVFQYKAVQRQIFSNPSCCEKVTIDVHKFRHLASIGDEIFLH